VDFGRASTFNLDEFVGLRPNHPGAYRTFMRRYLFDHVNLRREAAHFPASGPRGARAYERAIARAGGLDVCLVGIGANGHLGFNEPGASLEPWTHRVSLRSETRRANAYLFDGRWQDVPATAMSMGIATILQARTVLLIATGSDKRAIVRRALEGPITTRVPASLLQTHPHALAILDAAAARGLAAPPR
jgi:glucosamine-6-phosphate deaminase